MSTEVAEAPSDVETKPIYHAGKSPRGDKFRESMKSLESLPPGQEVVPERTDAAPAKEDSAQPAKETSKEAKKSPLDAVTAKTETKPDSESDPTKEFDEKTPNWKQAREVIATQSKLQKELQAEIARLKTSTDRSQPPADVAAIQKERDELKAKIEAQERDIKAIDGRYSDEYRALEKERSQAVQKAVTRFESYTGAGKGEALKEALSLPIGRFRSAQIKEALADIDPDDRARVLTLIENAEGAEDKIKDFEANLPEKWDEIQQRRDAQQKEKSEQSVKAMQTNFQKVAESLPEKNVTLRLVDDSQDDGTWNSDIKTAMEEAGESQPTQWRNL